MAEYLNNNKDDEGDDEYRDNPSKILAVTVTYEDDESKLFQSMKDVVRIIVSSWSVLSNDDIIVSKLSGGITNIIYLLRKNNNDSNNINTTMNPNAVIVRIYGDGTDIVIDRNTENNVFASLSSLRIGPIYYGRFQNGRVEGYLSARSLTMEEMCDPSLHPRTAYAIAQLHSQQVHDIDTSISVYTKVCKNIEIAKTLKFDDPHKRHLYERLNLSLIENELKGLNDYLYELMEDGLDLDSNSDDDGKKHFASWHRAGIKLAMDITLCHNDLLSGNILLSHELISFLDTDPSVRDDSDFNDTGGISLIDYEYAGYDYRGYDIANHFCEFGGFDFNIKEHFPKFETRAMFIYHYICAVANRKDTSLLRLDSGTRAAISYISSLTIGNIFNNEETLTFFLAVDSVIRPMCLLAHLYWGVWSIIQSRYSPVVDFEYLEYAHQRLNGYFYQKEEFNLNF